MKIKTFYEVLGVIFLAELAAGVAFLTLLYEVPAMLPAFVP